MKKKVDYLSLADILDSAKSDQWFENVIGYIKDGDGALTIGAAARPFILALMHLRLQRPLFVIAPSFDRARRIASDIRAFGVDAGLFPDVETMPYDSLSPGAASVGKRLSLLHEMQSGFNKVWVSYAQTAIRVLPAPSENIHLPLKLAVGDEIDLHELAEKLVTLGYVRQVLVDGHGQFSLRGGIIDVFPSNDVNPVRIEFFGDEVESIRPFGVSSQRSMGQLKQTAFYGCRQMILTEDNVKKSLLHFSNERSVWFEDEIGKLRDLQYFEGIDRYMPFLYAGATTVLDYLPAGTLTVFDEPEETLQLAERFFSQQESYIEHLIEHKVIAKPPFSYYVRPVELREKGLQNLDFVSIGALHGAGAVIRAIPVKPIAGRINELPDQLREIKKKGLKTVVALSNGSQIDRVKDLLDRDGIRASTDTYGERGAVTLVTGSLNSGFESSDIGVFVITSTDIFGKRAPKRKKRLSAKGNAISSLSELAIGDYVVHSSHGIAVYAGLQQREVAGVKRDYALLEYAGSDRLFVPIEQLDRITKYIGGAGDAPAVSRLGSAEWVKAKRKAEASVKKVAYDLLSLYAQRAKTKGFAFGPDTPWQAELEESFPFEETPDQLLAVGDVKRDMELTKPMDRLICGDVGYGKTEVAVRAAFKAIMDSKQVMVLVPTTILAQQHYKTFIERLAQFPATVETISRFKTSRQQQDIVERFNEGTIDVLIGTHRLLAGDIHPFDLGLVVIDEEQRFGVNDKDKLRNFKNSVDVMTLSATPIPRTLQMSIAGVRDMSTIDTPPEGRRPIITQVGRFNEEMLVEAIRREIGRDGQVYYVHNRVESIDRVANRLKELIPQAKIAVAHGQMSEHTLERIMLAFLNKQYDVLVCTTIIESGIDIPSVNTLIVDRAELLGLAQLYQLRGRVGRANCRAYAYFFHSAQQTMTTQAFERLKTISDFTELGSGMKIALRDLEIRGAGNLLGAEQHGNMSSIGFELYCQMLREAIEDLEGGAVPERVDIKIDLPLDAYIPESYIAEGSLRIEAYKKIVLARSLGELELVETEFDDRYGSVPMQVRCLLEIAKIRQRARALGITEIVYRNDRIKISPIRLDKRRALLIARAYDNIMIHSDRQYLLATRLKRDKIIAFLITLLDDIIIAPSLEVEGSQKAR